MKKHIDLTIEEYTMRRLEEKGYPKHNLSALTEYLYTQYINGQTKKYRCIKCEAEWFSVFYPGKCLNCDAGPPAILCIK